MAQTEQIRDDKGIYRAAVSRCHQLLWLIDRIRVHHQPLLDALDAAIRVAQSELPMTPKEKTLKAGKAAKKC